MRFSNIFCVASAKHGSKEVLSSVLSVIPNLKVIEYNKSSKLLDIPDCIDLLMVLGGDGFMLDIIHSLFSNNIFLKKKFPIYGLNCGNIGFLMNKYKDRYLLSNLEDAKTITVSPLIGEAVTCEETVYIIHALNEISVIRNNYQAAHLSISVNRVNNISKLVCDGAMVSTPIGSTAYNYAAGGNILPLESNVLNLTPISPFRPKDWRGAILLDSSEIQIDIMNTFKRPASVVADSFGIPKVKSVRIKKDNSIKVNLLYNNRFGIEEKRIKETFFSSTRSGV